VKLPNGYGFEWAGQFQELQDAVKRLEIVVPISILLIFALLYGNLRDLCDSLLVLGAAPPALVGGILHYSSLIQPSVSLSSHLPGDKN
jgi:cobalt-zinc-cadmium resistance protein CzcA